MRKLLIALSLAALTSGCGMLYRTPIYQGNLLEKSNVEQLQQGMDKRQVMNLLGSPSVADPFHHDRWDYVATQRTGRTGPAERKTLTLWFENDQLAKWDGEYFGEQDEQLAKEMHDHYGNLPVDKKKKKQGR